MELNKFSVGVVSQVGFMMRMWFTTHKEVINDFITHTWFVTHIWCICSFHMHIVRNQMLTYPCKVVGISVDSLEVIGIVEQTLKVVEPGLHFGDRVTLQVGQAPEPLLLREEAHLTRLHPVRQHQHDYVLRFNPDVLAELFHAFWAKHVRVVGCCVLPEPRQAALLVELRGLVDAASTIPSRTAQHQT